LIDLPLHGDSLRSRGYSNFTETDDPTFANRTDLARDCNNVMTERSNRFFCQCLDYDFLENLAGFDQPNPDGNENSLAHVAVAEAQLPSECK
jgi:hypothetical protein